MQWKRAICCSTHNQVTQHVAPQPLGPQANVCCDLCYPCAFISHVWSSFHGCLSQQAIPRFTNQFHQPIISHTHVKLLWHRCFHGKTVDRSFWLTFALQLVLLPIQHSRSESHAPEKLYACHHQRLWAHSSGHNTLALSGRRTPTNSEHSTPFRYFSREFKAPKNRKWPD